MDLEIPLVNFYCNFIQSGDDKSSTEMLGATGLINTLQTLNMSHYMKLISRI